MVPLPSAHHHRAPGGQPSLARVTALACLLAQASAALCEAGTVVRGRLLVPASLPESAHVRDQARVAHDAGDAVIYVTQPAGRRGKKLGRKAVREHVALSGNRFTPPVVPVVVSSRVRFENPDRVYHNVFSISPALRFDLGKLSPGTTREVRFDSAGVVQLFCELHPAAAGFIVVCPNRVYARPNASGEYALPSLPRGTYVVHAWHPRLGSLRRSIDVSGHGGLTLDLRF